jgi:hypothetical protein
MERRSLTLGLALEALQPVADLVTDGLTLQARYIDLKLL